MFTLSLITSLSSRLGKISGDEMVDEAQLEIIKVCAYIWLEMFFALIIAHICTCSEH